MGTEQLTPAQVISMYRADTLKLYAYLPYFEKMNGQKVSNTFDQDGLSQHSLVFPVYDGNLLRFVKDAEQTAFMNRNYRYTFTRYRIKTAADEHALIDKCTILQLDVIGDILTKLFILLRWVVAAAFGIFSCSVELLVAAYGI